MIEPVALQNFFITFFSAAMVIMTGGLYALLFAYARIKRRPALMWMAYAAYASLVVSVVTLAAATNLFGNMFWITVVALMLVGYLLAPHAIWHLCVGTHGDEADAHGAPDKDFSTVVNTRGV